MSRTFFFVPTSTPPSEHFEINLIGAIYFPDLLHTFLGGIATWYDALSPPQRRQVRLRHIGSHGELVRATAQRLLPALSIDVPGYVPTTQMAQLCQRANINAYISHPAGFHHKLLELLACGRPVLAFPSENHESVALAAQVKGQLIVPSTPAALTSALNDLSTPFFGHNEPVRNLPGTNASRYSWRAQARLLQDVLATVAPPK